VIKPGTPAIHCDIVRGGRGNGLRGRTYIDLEIDDDVISEEAVHALVNDWLVPAIVDGILRDLAQGTAV
jgi:hypothetical protein